jgi:hypothetical protein
MEPQYEGLSAEELAARLGKSEHLFDVAFDALLRIGTLDPAHAQEIASDAIALIDRYPNDERFIAGYPAGTPA